MHYYLDSDKISLRDLQKRIKETDLIPSRSSLLNGIEDNFKRLEKFGISTLSNLRKELKNSKSIPSLSKQIGIDGDYLTLLRREIEGYFPKALPLRSFDWLPGNEMAALGNSGFRDTVSLFEGLDSPRKRSEIAKDLGLDGGFIDFVYSLADLTRIQWTSPIFARMLLAAGYDSAKKVSEADAGELFKALDRVNKESKFFMGKLGPRDIKRLIKAASYVP
jgi:hypothetical protein